MSNDNAETRSKTDVAAATDQRMIENHAQDVPAPAATRTARPWTADFLLPSIRFREPNHP
jgi:hypothetical protein